MGIFSPLNLSQSVLLDDNRKQIVKENSNIDWSRELLMKWYESMKAKGGTDSPILPTSPKTFSF